MSGAGEPTLDLERADEVRLAIVAAQWHETICTALLNGATGAATAAGVADLTIIRVAGAIEEDALLAYSLRMPNRDGNTSAAKPLIVTVCRKSAAPGLLVGVFSPGKPVAS